MSIAYVALGSNQRRPLQQVTQALQEIGQLQQCAVKAHSPWYQSSAVGPGEQPDYVNGVAQLETELSPLDLLQSLQSIEDAHGRLRGERWGPRTLDLDILLYDNLTVDSAKLTIPHPRMQQRNFVLQPLFDISEDITLPCGTMIASLLQSCPQQGLQPLAGEMSDP